MNTYIILTLVFVVIFLMTRTERFYGGNSVPPFMYPADYPQPLGTKGWGYRNPTATLQTLRWQESRPALLMPDFEQPRGIPGYRTHLQESAPVPIKHNDFCDPQARPPVISVQQRAVASSPYANWASDLQA